MQNTVDATCTFVPVSPRLQKKRGHIQHRHGSLDDAPRNNIIALQEHSIPFRGLSPPPDGMYCTTQEQDSAVHASPFSPRVRSWEGGETLVARCIRPVLSYLTLPLVPYSITTRPLYISSPHPLLAAAPIGPAPGKSPKSRGSGISHPPATPNRRPRPRTWAFLPTRRSSGTGTGLPGPRTRGVQS